MPEKDHVDQPESKQAGNRFAEQDGEADVPGESDVACDLLDVLVGGWRSYAPGVREAR